MDQLTDLVWQHWKIISSVLALLVVIVHDTKSEKDDMWVMKLGQLLNWLKDRKKAD